MEAKHVICKYMSTNIKPNNQQLPYLSPLLTRHGIYIKCPQAAYGPSKMSKQVTTLHDVK